MRVARVALGLAITMAASAAACGGGTDAPLHGASGPGRNGSTEPPAPADAADAAPDGPASNGGLARWSAALGGPQVDVGFAVSGDGGGDTVVAGSFQGTAELGGVPMTSAGATDLFVAKYGPDGKPQWVRRFGGAADDMATSVVVAPSGTLWIAGASAGALDFGTGPLGQGGAAGTFLVELDRFGNVMLAKAYGGASYGTLVGLAAGSDGSIALSGAYQGTVDLGGGPRLRARTGHRVLPHAGRLRQRRAGERRGRRRVRRDVRPVSAHARTERSAARARTRSAMGGPTVVAARHNSRIALPDTATRLPRRGQMPLEMHASGLSGTR